MKWRTSGGVCGGRAYPEWGGGTRLARVLGADSWGKGEDYIWRAACREGLISQEEEEAHSKAFHSSSLFDRGQPILRAWTDSHGRSSQKPSGCRRLTSPSRPPASFGITKYKTHGKIHGRKSTFIRRIASRALVTSFESSCIKYCTRYPSGCTPVGIPQSASHNHSRIPLLKQHLENPRSLTPTPSSPLSQIHFLGPGFSPSRLPLSPLSACHMYHTLITYRVLAYSHTHTHDSQNSNRLPTLWNLSIHPIPPYPSLSPHLPSPSTVIYTLYIYHNLSFTCHTRE